MTSANETWLKPVKHKYDEGSYAMHHTRIPGVRAQFAMELSKQLGVALACPDGEDSSGKQKFRMLTPEEVAERACAISESMFAGFEDRGWILDLPSCEEPPAGSP